MIAVALLVLQLLGYAFNQAQAFTPAVLAVCVAYLVATVMLRILGAPRPTLPRYRAALAAFDRGGHSGGLRAAAAAPRHHELHALVRIAHPDGGRAGHAHTGPGHHGSGHLAALLWAWWTGDQSSSDDAQRYLQSALTGTGYLS